jgi:hypothetical protein
MSVATKDHKERKKVHIFEGFFFVIFRGKKIRRGWSRPEQCSISHSDIAWAVAFLLQFGQDSLRIKAAAGFPAVDQGQAARAGQAVRVFSQT